jgi:lipid-A-disaccharide synthase-like uncharacterized protein
MSLDPMTWDFWIAFGFLGQAAFSARFLVQWVWSERKGESYIPIYFWYFSLLGGLILTIYAVHRRDPVFIVGQSFGLLVYIRNLMLIRNRMKAPAA